MDSNNNPFDGIESVESFSRCDEDIVNEALKQGHRLLGVASGTNDEGNPSIFYAVGVVSEAAKARARCRADYAEAHSEDAKQELEREGYEVVAVHPRAEVSLDYKQVAWTVYVMRRWVPRRD
jgi:hypothetical protein